MNIYKNVFKENLDGFFLTKEGYEWSYLFTTEAVY